MRLALLALAAATLATGAHAQSVPHDPSICTLHVVGGVAVPGPPIDIAEDAERRGGEVTRVVTRGAASTFEVQYTGFNNRPEAQAAFQRAVDIWADHLASPVVITVRADFDGLGQSTGILGSANAQNYADDVPNDDLPRGARQRHRR